MDHRYHPEWDTISKLIREKFGWKCARCASSDLLQTHHIDGNPKNNHEENLIPLCATCHLQIEKESSVQDTRQQEIFPESNYKRAIQKIRQDALMKEQGKSGC